MSSASIFKLPSTQSVQKGCGLWTLSCDFVPHNYETFKWLSSLPILMQESFWWRQCSDRYIISLIPRLHTPFLPVPNKPYGFFVDVKHHIYFAVGWWGDQCGSLCALYAHGASLCDGTTHTAVLIRTAPHSLQV